MSAAVIRLSSDDNVVVCCRPIAAGEAIAIAGRALVAAQAVELGHKIALVPLAAGDKVIKYGMPIGSMTAAASPGEWIHVHNMKSDYLPAHLRNTAGAPA